MSPDSPSLYRRHRGEREKEWRRRKIWPRWEKALGLLGSIVVLVPFLLKWDRPKERTTECVFPVVSSQEMVTRRDKCEGKSSKNKSVLFLLTKSARFRKGSRRYFSVAHGWSHCGMDGVSLNIFATSSLIQWSTGLNHIGWERAADFPHWALPRLSLYLLWCHFRLIPPFCSTSLLWSSILFFYLPSEIAHLRGRRHSSYRNDDCPSLKYDNTRVQ